MVELDAAVAIDWLQRFDPDGPWTLVAIDPVPAPEQRPTVHLAEFHPGQESPLAAWLMSQHDNKLNLYFTVNQPILPFRTARKEAMERCRALHVDVDLPGDATDAEASQRQLDELRSLDPPPTAIVFSGGGHQGFWRLAEKLPAGEYGERIERVNQAIHGALRGGDACHDISRLMRLPGTINLPNRKKLARGRVPVAAYVVEADWSRTWSFSKDAVPRPPPEAITSDDDQEAASGVLATLPPSLRRLIKAGDARDFDGDRSRLGWFVMCGLIRSGWTDDDITKVFLDRSYGVSAHYLEQAGPAAYVARNLVRAHERVTGDWNRHTRTGTILAENQGNLDRALVDLNLRLTYDEFADRTWVNGAGPLRQLTDPVLNKIWLSIDADMHFKPKLEFFKIFISDRARRKSYHPVRTYLDHLPTWDGVPRLDDWLARYGEAESSPYTRAVGRLTLVAAVRRARQPGCKFDEMLMLINPQQGTNKSTAVRTLAVNDDWFNDYLPLGEVGKEVIEHVRGFWIIEASEMAGLSTRELEKIKGFCSRQTDRGRMSYDRLVSDVPRSCVFIGTTNEESLFLDLANRRFWPVTVGTFDIPALRADLHQLWAEAVAAETSGESIRLDPSLYPAAGEAQDQYRIEDAWSTTLDDALGDLRGYLLSSDAWKIINKHVGAVMHVDGRRLGRAMRDIGFKRRQRRVPSAPNPKWIYERGSTPHEINRPIYVHRDPVSNDLYVGHEPSPTQSEADRYAEEIPF